MKYILAAGGKYKGFEVYDVPPRISPPTKKRLIIETSIIGKLSSGDEVSVSDEDKKKIEKWKITQDELDSLGRVNITILDHYMSADGPIVSIGVNEHRILFVCKEYPIQFPNVYKIIEPGKMITIGLWVDKTGDEGRLKFLQNLQNLKENANWSLSHLLNVIVLVASFITPPAAGSDTTSGLASLRF